MTYWGRNVAHVFIENLGERKKIYMLYYYPYLIIKCSMKPQHELRGNLITWK